MHQYQKVWLVIKALPLYITACCLSPFILWLCSIFLIYRRILDLILRLKYGDKYGGLFSLADSIWMIKDKCKSTASISMIAKCSKETDMYTFIKEEARTKVFCYPRPYPKLTNTYRILSGYPFWIKSDNTFDDHFKLLPISDDTVFDEGYFKEACSNLYDAPYSHNYSTLWDCHISPKPLENFRKDGLYYYPLVFRFNHAIADGTSISEFFIQFLGSNKIERYSKKIFDKLFKKTSSKKSKRRILFEKIWSGLKYLVNFTWLSMYAIFIGSGSGLKNIYLKKRDQNLLHGPELTGKKIIAWRVEESSEYIPMVKRIKNRVPHTTFSDVVMTAISGSFTDYFKKGQQPLQDKFSCIMAQLLHFPDMDTSKPVSLNNKTTFIFYDFPTNKNNLLDTLDGIKRSKKKISYGDVMCYNLIGSYLAGIFPLPIASIMLGPLAYTNALTNVPGSSKATMINGGVMESVIGIAPNTKSTGVSLSITSYDDRFQMGILVDKAIMSSREEVQKLLDNILYYIKCLDNETRKIYG